MRKPISFVANVGKKHPLLGVPKEFKIRVVKTNIRSYWLELLGEGKTIKVKKSSKKLVWREGK